MVLHCYYGHKNDKIGIYYTLSKICLPIDPFMRQMKD